MDNLAGANKQFRNLLDAIAADHVGLRPSMGMSSLGPSVGDDITSPVLTALGPCVGDDDIAVSLTMLGPSVGDDNLPTLTALGPCVGDDQSDSRLKEDVRRIGTTVFGLPLYHFRYLGKPETYEGVMAQDVLQVMPDAVSVGVDGYYRVNYGALGMSMRQVS